MTEPGDPSPSLFTELKRRRVFRAATAYAAGGFVLLEGADLLLPALFVPDWVYRLLVILVVVGFPIALVLSWLFELTPQGLRRVVGGEEDRLVVPLRRLLLYTGSGLLLLLLLGSSALWLRSRASGQVARGADVIAVVPFAASGIGVEGMREGIVDLLSRNLDEIGVIRTVDPRTVLRRWHERAGDADLPREELLRVGRDVEASSVLTGSVISVGGRVRIQAELLAVDGTRVAATTVEGEESRTLELVDSLAVALLREIWRSREPLPRMDLAAVTSTNPDALRAFLAGEQLYRISDWSAAAAAFERALEADSAFALAHFRLYQVAGWARTSTRGRSGHLEAAERHKERLPLRIRSLLVAERAIADDREAEALDSLRVLSRRYPDDPEVWLALADARFHLEEGAVHAGGPVAQQLELFDRALELDHGYLPALIHPLEIAFLHEEIARVRHYLELAREISSVPPAAVDILERGLAVVEDSALLVELISTLGLVLVTLDEERDDLRWQAAKAVLPAVRRRVVLLPAAESDVVVRWLDGRFREDAGEFGRSAVSSYLETLVATGRLETARAFLAAATAPGRFPGPQPPVWSVLPALAGVDAMPLGDPTTGARGRGPETGAESGPVQHGPAEHGPAERNPLQAIAAASSELAIAIDRRDSGALQSLATRLEREAAVSERGHLAVEARDLARVARIFIRAIGGSRNALEEAEAGLARVLLSGRGTAWYEAAWLRWLELAVDHSSLRGQVIERLQRPWPGSAVYEPRRLLALARALAAEGHREEAMEAYRTASAALAAADPGLTIQTILADVGSAVGADEVGRPPGSGLGGDHP